MKVRLGGSLCCLLFAFCLSPFRFAHAHESQWLETGSASKILSVHTAPSEIKIVSYNIRWRGGDDLRKLVQLLRDDAEIGQAQIIGLQEVDRNRKRTGNVNTARLIASELGLHYVWAAPPPAGKEAQEEETGVAILSPYPMTDVTRIVLPNPGPGGRRRAAVGATIRIGATPLRVYSVHAETRTSNEKRLEQLQAVLDDLKKHHAKTERAVVLGDFNTITGKDVNATSSHFTTAGFTTPFPNSESTWKTFIIELKLDWIWLRGFHGASQFGIDRKIRLSDHWPLWVKVNLNAAAQAEDEADIRGSITNVRRAHDDDDKGDSRSAKLLGTVMIEGVKEADTNFDKASVRVTNETRIFDRRGKERKQASFDDLKPGRKVAARFTGPVMESYPVQATASEIVILH
ncbi:MAG: endonuclease/exonuclease/phosphatase family protein [Pyrinomonadaceae bacterium]